MVRGIEIILKGRDPRDASHYTQRICGVCPISHGLAAALKSGFGAGSPAARLVQPATTLSAPSGAGATNIKVASVADFAAGQTITIDTGASLETAVIAMA